MFCYVGINVIRPRVFAESNIDNLCRMTLFYVLYPCMNGHGSPQLLLFVAINKVGIFVISKYRCSANHLLGNLFVAFLYISCFSYTL